MQKCSSLLFCFSKNDRKKIPVGDGEHDGLDFLGFLLSADGALDVGVVASLNDRVTMRVADERRKLSRKNRLDYRHALAEWLSG